MNIDDCLAIDPLVWVSKARSGWQQGQRALSHILRRGRPRRANAHHDRGRHNKPRPAAAVAGTIPIERVKSEWVLQRQTKQSDQPEGNRLRMDILFRNLDQEFDGTNIQFLHRRTSPTSVELVFFHSEGMASLIGVGLRFAVVELVAAGDSMAGLDVNRVIVRECSEQWWKELWMDNTSTRHGGYTSLLVQLKGHSGPAEYFGGGVAIAETGWSSPGSASCIDLNPSPQCGSIRDLLACILRHGAAPDPEQGRINLRPHAQLPTEGAAPDGDEAADTAAAAAAAGTGHGDIDGSSSSQQQSRSISAGESSNLESAGLGDHTKPSLDPEKSRSAKGKANVVPSTASAGDAQPADPWPTDFTVELLFKAVRGCDTTSVSVRNPDQATAGGNFHPPRRRKIWDWLVPGRRRRKGHHRLHSNNDAARLARQLSPASDSVSSSTRTTTTTSLQGTPPHAHQLAMTPEDDDAAADPAVDPAVDDDDGLWLPAVPADHKKHPELNQCYLKPQLCISFRHPDGFSIRMQAGFEVPTRLPIGVAHDNLHISFNCADSNNAVHLERAADEGTEKEGLRSSSARTVEWGQAGTMELSAGVGASSLKLGVTVDRRAADTLTAEHPTHYTKLMDLNNFEVKSEELGNRVAFRATHRPPFLHGFKPAPARGGRQWAGAFLRADLACSGDYRIDYGGFRDYAMLMEREVYVTSDTAVLKKGNQAFLKRLQINHSFVPNPQAQVVGLPSSSTSTASNSKISWKLYTGRNEEQARPFVREAERGEERLWFLRHAPDKEVEHDMDVDMLQKIVQDEGLGDDDDGVDRHVLAAQVLEIKKQEFRASRMQGRLNRLPRQPPPDAWAPHHNSTSEASTSHAL